MDLLKKIVHQQNPEKECNHDREQHDRYYMVYQVIEFTQKKHKIKGIIDEEK